MSFPSPVMDGFLTHDLLHRHQKAGTDHASARPIFRPSEAGWAYFRRLSAGIDPYREQHFALGTRYIRDDQKANTRHLVNEAETPLGWLRRRKGTDGKPLISQVEYDSGERLREDFTRAQLTPSLTVNWSAVEDRTHKQAGGSAGPANIYDAALAAKKRFDAAIGAVGPGLGDLLIETCCHLNGLERSEQAFGWPRRSGKVVLQIALDRLARHYGLIATPRKSSNGVRSWAGLDAVPKMDP